MMKWDPDGAGPGPAQLVAGGVFATAGGVTVNRIGRWDGVAWQPFGSGFIGGGVLALTTWDPDGAGPEPSQPVAGGEFNSTGGITMFGIARWDGAAWRPFGSGIGGSVYALTTWDPDGAGSRPAQLIAGGWFTTAGGVAVNSVASWDGSAWRPLGSGMNNPVHALTTWDPDGAGPEPAQLVAGGRFTTAGGVTVNNIAWWDGAAWHPFGSGMNGRVNALTTWDPDGAGPEPAQLAAGGAFTTSGGVSANRTAGWDGVAWRPLGSGVNDEVFALSVWESNEAGHQSAQLIAGGDFTIAGGISVSRVARWDGVVWQTYGSGTNYRVCALGTWDPDGAGPHQAQPVAGGAFTSAGGVALAFISRWNGEAWQALGNSTNGRVHALATWNPGGNGPEPTRLVAGGEFDIAGGVEVNNIACWDGAAWRPLGNGMDGPVSALTAWDPDGVGVQPARLVAGGWFTAAGTNTVNRIARWEGTAWRPLGSGMDASVNALSEWDPDGAGPEPTQLVAGGSFTTAGGVTVNRIASWDSAVWRPLGSGVNGSVRALTTWDPDGAGPQAPQLVAGGLFTVAGGVTVNRVARWDGEAWQPLGSGMNSDVFAFTTWDPDGAGPQQAQLAAGGAFTTAGGVSVNRMASWDGAAWRPLGSGVNSLVYALAAWDPDGAGPQRAQPVAGGWFRTAGGATVNYVSGWDGEAWLPFGSGMNDSVYALVAWDPDGAGSQPAQPVAGGGFTAAGGGAASYLATWAAHGPVPPWCSADFNNSGATTVQDIFDFVAAYLASDPRADFDGDGTLDVQDVIGFLAAYFTGCE